MRITDAIQPKKKEEKGLHMKNTPEEDGCKSMLRYQTKNAFRGNTAIQNL